MEPKPGLGPSLRLPDSGNSNFKNFSAWRDSVSHLNGEIIELFDRSTSRSRRGDMNEAQLAHSLAKSVELGIQSIDATSEALRQMFVDLVGHVSFLGPVMLQSCLFGGIAGYFFGDCPCMEAIKPLCTGVLAGEKWEELLGRVAQYAACARLFRWPSLPYASATPVPVCDIKMGFHEYSLHEASCSSTAEFEKKHSTVWLLGLDVRPSWPLRALNRSKQRVAVRVCNKGTPVVDTQQQRPPGEQMGSSAAAYPAPVASASGQARKGGKRKSVSSSPAQLTSAAPPFLPNIPAPIGVLSDEQVNSRMCVCMWEAHKCLEADDENPSGKVDNLLACDSSDTCLYYRDLRPSAEKSTSGTGQAEVDWSGPWFHAAHIKGLETHTQEQLDALQWWCPDCSSMNEWRELYSRDAPQGGGPDAPTPIPHADHIVFVLHEYEGATTSHSVQLGDVKARVKPLPAGFHTHRAFMRTLSESAATFVRVCESAGYASNGAQQAIVSRISTVSRQAILTGYGSLVNVFYHSWHHLVCNVEQQMHVPAWYRAMLYEALGNPQGPLPRTVMADIKEQVSGMKVSGKVAEALTEAMQGLARCVCWATLFGVRLPGARPEQHVWCSLQDILTAGQGTHSASGAAEVCRRSSIESAATQQEGEDVRAVDVSDRFAAGGGRVRGALGSTTGTGAGNGRKRQRDNASRSHGQESADSSAVSRGGSEAAAVGRALPAQGDRDRDAGEEEEEYEDIEGGDSTGGGGAGCAGSSSSRSLGATPSQGSSEWSHAVTGRRAGGPGTCTRGKARHSSQGTATDVHSCTPGSGSASAHSSTAHLGAAAGGGTGGSYSTANRHFLSHSHEVEEEDEEVQGGIHGAAPPTVHPHPPAHHADVEGDDVEVEDATAGSSASVGRPGKRMRTAVHGAAASSSSSSRPARRMSAGGAR